MSADLKQARRVLCALAPIQIHPRWETAVAGRPVQDVDWPSLSSFRKLLLWKSYGQYHRSNPRTPRYMSDLALTRLPQIAPEAQFDVLAPEANREQMAPAFLARMNQFFPLAQRNRILPDVQKTLRSQTYDAVLLFYPDAIGCGWGSLEKSLIKLNSPVVQVISGRRREFPLNNRFRRKLAWRRALETTWLMEIAWVCSLLITSVALALWDAPRRVFHHGR